MIPQAYQQRWDVQLLPYVLGRTGLTSTEKVLLHKWTSVLLLVYWAEQHSRWGRQHALKYHRVVVKSLHSMSLSPYCTLCVSVSPPHILHALCHRGNFTFIITELNRIATGIVSSHFAYDLYIHLRPCVEWTLLRVNMVQNCIFSDSCSASSLLKKFREILKGFMQCVGQKWPLHDSFFFAL
jgi:hypothetical protein